MYEHKVLALLGQGLSTVITDFPFYFIYLMRISQGFQSRDNEGKSFIITLC